MPGWEMVAWDDDKQVITRNYRMKDGALLVDRMGSLERSPVARTDSQETHIARSPLYSNYSGLIGDTRSWRLVCGNTLWKVVVPARCFLRQNVYFIC
jgi:hypothetical protein